MSDNTKVKKTIGSVIKAFEVIELLSTIDSELGVTEISNHLDFGVSATYHLLATLHMLRIIEQDTTTKKYRLGLRLCQIGEKAKEQNQLINYIRPYLKRIRDFTGETTNLTVLDNRDIIYVAQEESGKLVRMFTKLGARVPLYCSAAGKVLLAYQPAGRREAIFEQLSFQKFTERTIATSHSLRRELDQIIKSGFGCDDEERELGVSCYAVPVFGFEGKVIAAISISGPTMRLDESVRVKYIEYLLAITKEISDDLSHNYSTVH